MWTTHGSSATKMRKHDRLQKFPDKEAIKEFVSEVEACPKRARRKSKERYLTGTHGQPQMPPDLWCGGQRRQYSKYESPPAHIPVDTSSQPSAARVFRCSVLSSRQGTLSTKYSHFAVMPGSLERRATSVPERA
jgi:hypothetical protein